MIRNYSVALVRLILFPVKCLVTPLAIWPAIITGAATLGAGLIGALSNSSVNSKNLSFANKELQFSKDQFEYSKWLNRNQYQLQASDAQKAGINPLAMNGGNLTAGSYSSGANPNQQGFTPDISPITQIASAALQAKTQKEIASDANASAEKIASEKNETEENIANAQIRSQQTLLTQRLTQEDRQFQQKLAQDFSIENIRAELVRRGQDSQKAIEDAKRVSEQLKRNDDYQLAQQNIKLEEEKIKNAKTEAEKANAIRSRNGWLNFASSIFHTIVNGVISFVGGSSNAGTSNPVHGFTADNW